MCLQLVAFGYVIIISIYRVNVTSGETEERMMMTGMHTVADIFCVGCGSIVGWKYVRLESMTWIMMTCVYFFSAAIHFEILMCSSRRLLMKRARSTRKENPYLSGQ